MHTKFIQVRRCWRTRSVDNENDDGSNSSNSNEGNKFPLQENIKLVNVTLIAEKIEKQSE